MCLWFTEVKEKTTGRRRSTYRRKSNINPKPDPDPDLGQDGLSQEPKMDPDPGPPHPNPTTSESSTEPAPSAEEQDTASTAPTATYLDSICGPASSPGAQLPPSSGPILVPSPKKAPDPEEEDRPTVPSHIPAAVEVVCNTGIIPMETEGGGVNPLASPVEQSPDRSPDRSPCSSPSLSPCLQLEDEDSLSPLFQRSLSEDSGDSPTLSLGHTKKRSACVCWCARACVVCPVNKPPCPELSLPLSLHSLKLCAFCYRGDEPPLGQGRLVVFGPTPGYIPLHILNRRASSDRDNDCHDHCYRNEQALPT